MSRHREQGRRESSLSVCGSCQLWTSGGQIQDQRLFWVFFGGGEFDRKTAEWECTGLRMHLKKIGLLTDNSGRVFGLWTEIYFKAKGNRRRNTSESIMTCRYLCDVGTFLFTEGSEIYRMQSHWNEAFCFPGTSGQLLKVFEDGTRKRNSNRPGLTSGQCRQLSCQRLMFLFLFSRAWIWRKRSTSSNHWMPMATLLLSNIKHWKQ